MRTLCVVGLGYVGTPVAALFARGGLEVTGLDLDPAKVAAINRGEVPFEGDEPELPEIIRATVASGALRASTDPAAIANADAVVLCVQTPFDLAKGEPNYGVLRSALETVGRHLRRGTLVVVESTIAPGTMTKVAIPALEAASGMTAGVDFLVGHCPERVMPGRLVHNLSTYGRPLGASTADAHARMRDLYRRICPDEFPAVDLTTAEVIKTFENTYRDVQIALANEFAKYCDTLGVDYFRVRTDVNRFPGRQLLLPGTGVGGHCIPKDTYLLAHGTKGTFVPELMLKARSVNDSMPDYVADKALRMLREAGLEPRQAVVTILGYSYLGDSDDTRSTPSEPLAAALERQGMEVRIHDPLVKRAPGRVIHPDLVAAARGADLLVVSTGHSAYIRADLAAPAAAMRTRLLLDARNVLDAARARQAGFRYAGLGC